MGTNGSTTTTTTQPPSWRTSGGGNSSPTGPNFLDASGNPLKWDVLGTGAAGGVSQNPDANNLPYVPENLYQTPDTNPAAWAMDKTNFNNLTLYSGSTPGVGTHEADLHGLLGQIAQKLGLKPQKGISTPEQIVRALAKMPGMNLPKGKASDEQLLGQIVHSISGQSSLPGAKAGKANLNDAGAWDQIAQRLNVQTDNPNGPKDLPRTPWTQVAQALVTMPKSQVAQIQGQLMAGGWYDSHVDPTSGDPTKIKEGNVDNWTMSAFGNMLQYAAKSGNNTWGDYLNRDATARGYANGQTLTDVLNAGGGDGKKPASVPVATQGQLAPSLRSAYENDLGYGPSAGALQGFTQQYDQAQAIHAGDATHYVDQNNVPQMAGLAAPTAAAGNYAVNTEDGAFLGHSISNAAALIQNALRGDHPLNSNPNLTTAARPL